MVKPTVVTIITLLLIFVILLATGKLFEILTRLIVSVDYLTLSNAMYLYSEYTALAFSDFYFYGSFEPFFTKNYNFSINNITLNFPFGMYGLINSSGNTIIAKAQGEYRLEFPVNIPGNLFVPSMSNLSMRRVPFIGIAGTMRSRERGSLGANKILEFLYYICRHQVEEDTLIWMGYIDLEKKDDKTIVINGVEYPIGECMIKSIGNCNGFKNLIIAGFISSGGKYIWVKCE